MVNTPHALLLLASLEHQLNNFSECWWDHWILDVIICNGGGTILGIYTLRSAPSANQRPLSRSRDRSRPIRGHYLGLILFRLVVVFRYLSMKTYNWRALYEIPTFRGKIKRFFGQVILASHWSIHLMLSSYWSVFSARLD